MDKLETFFTPSQQLMQFLFCILLGIFLGVLYDIFRVIRTLIPHNSFFVAAEDFIFVVIWGLELLIYSMEEGRGIIRFFFFVGNIIGFTLYHFTIGNLIINVIRKTTQAILKFLGIIFKPVFRLFAFLHQILNKFFVKLNTKIKKHCGNVKIHLKGNTKMMYNKTNAKNVIGINKDVVKNAKGAKSKKN